VTPATPEEDRLRAHPTDRLDAVVQRVDLVEAAATLRAEAHAAVSGHRQLAVVRHGPFSMILFAFEPGGYMKEHQADGEVIVHVLRGLLSVTVAAEEVTLTAGQLLALAPGQRHAVRALEESDMLLCIARGSR
jgi:quercetin dioxygenase-like cupin family protein